MILSFLCLELNGLHTVVLHGFLVLYSSVFSVLYDRFIKVFHHRIGPHIHSSLASVTTSQSGTLH